MSEFEESPQDIDSIEPTVGYSLLGTAIEFMGDVAQGIRERYGMDCLISLDAWDKDMTDRFKVAIWNGVFHTYFTNTEDALLFIEWLWKGGRYAT